MIGPGSRLLDPWTISNWPTKNPPIARAWVGLVTPPIRGTVLVYVPLIVLVAERRALPC